MAAWISPPNTTMVPSPALSAGAGHGDRVEQVGRAVGAGPAGRAVGPGEHDRGLGVMQQRAQDGELLERVGAGGDHHALAGVGDLLGPAGEVERLVKADLRPGQREHDLGLQPRHRRQLRHRLDSCSASSAGTARSPCMAIVPPAASSRTGRVK